MVNKISEINLNGENYPIAFTMTALEKIEEDTGSSYLALEVSAKVTGILLFRGIEDGHRIKKIPMAKGKSELTDGLFMDPVAYKKLWDIFNVNISFGEYKPEEDQVEEKKIQ